MKTSGVLLTAALVLAVAAGPAAFASSVAAPVPARTYADACGTCHDNGGLAVRVLTDRLGSERALIHKRNNLSPVVIRTVVRRGMGAMPAMSKLEVSDAELDAIIAYLATAKGEEGGR